MYSVMLKLKLTLIHSLYEHALHVQIFVVILVQCMLQPVAKMLRHPDQKVALNLHVLQIAASHTCVRYNVHLPLPPIQSCSSTF